MLKYEWNCCLGCPPPLGVDLDDSEAVWARLSEDERRQFRDLVEGGDVASILPPYQPWWGVEGEGQGVVELTQQEVGYPPYC